MRDRASMLALLEQVPPDMVIHAAARPSEWDITISLDDILVGNVRALHQKASA